MTEARPSVRFVFVQKERERYPDSLARLLGLLDAFADHDPRVVVVDNDRVGDWEHSVGQRLTHIGGDNREWEFSAFERGIAWFRDQEDGPAVHVLVTDACLAYGADYLELLGDHVVALATSHQAAVGWIDSFGETCEAFGRSYDSWLRTSFLFLPAGVLPVVEPLAWPIRRDEMFTDDPGRPFRPDAPVSRNLRRLLRAWLTRDPDVDGELDETWHSRFELDDETLPLFQDKVLAIVREHMISARLHEAGTPVYDFRALERWRDRDRKLPPVGDLEPYRWLGWHAMEPEPQPESPEQASDAGPGHAARQEAPVFGYGPVDSAADADLVAYLASRVLPLVRQRHAGAELWIRSAPATPVDSLPGLRLVDHSAPLDALLGACTVFLARPSVAATARGLEAEAERLGVPVSRVVAAGDRPSPSDAARELCRFLDGNGSGTA